MSSVYVRKPQVDRFVLAGPGSIIENKNSRQLRKVTAVELDQAGNLVFVSEMAEAPTFQQSVSARVKTTRLSEKTLRNSWYVKTIVPK